MCRCVSGALKTAGGALAAASYELASSPSVLSTPASPAAARSPFEAVLDSCQRGFSGFGAVSASNALVDLEAITSQRSIASSKVPCASLSCNLLR